MIGGLVLLLFFGLGPSFRREAYAEAVGFTGQSSKVPGQVMSVAPGDLDGDGLEDLTVAYRRGVGPTAERFLAVFFRRPEGLSRTPDLAFGAPRGAAIFDVGDVDGAPGEELVYLTDSGVWAHGFGGRTGKPVEKILPALSLIGDPEDDDLPSWDFVRNLSSGAEAMAKGAGRDRGSPSSGRNGGLSQASTSTPSEAARPATTILLPGRRDLRLFRPGASSVEPFCRVRVEQKSYYSVQGAGPASPRGARGGSFAFRVTTTIPNLELVEADGDGRLDLVTHFEDLISFHPGTEDGCFARTAARRQLMGMRTREELRSDDAFVSASVQDLDGDGIADLALTKVSGGLTNFRTEIRLHRGEKGGGYASEPAQVFQTEGFGAFAQFEDIDGDGAVDMVQPRAEISILGLTRVLLSQTAAIDIVIRKRSSDPRRFFDPEPVQVLETVFGLDFSSSSGLLGSIPLFGHDFNGDGRPDLLLSRGKDRMALHRGRAGAKPFEDDSRYVLEGPGSFSTRVLRPGLGMAPEVLVWYPGRKGLDDTLNVYRPNLPGLGEE